MDETLDGADFDGSDSGTEDGITDSTSEKEKGKDRRTSIETSVMETEKKVLVKYIEGTPTLHNVSSLTNKAKEVFDHLRNRDTLELDKDDFDRVIKEMENPFEPKQYCVVSIESAIGGAISEPVSKVKEEVRQRIRQFETVIFCFFVRSKMSEGDGTFDEVCSEEVVTDLLKSFPLRTYFCLKFIEEGIHTSDAKLKTFEYIKEHSEGPVTAIMDVDPVLITTYALTQDISDVVYKYSNKLENTCNTFVDANSLEIELENCLANEITESKLKNICMEGEHEGRTHRPTRIKTKILQETTRKLSETIVDFMRQSPLIMQSSSTPMTFVVSTKRNIKLQVQDVLLCVKDAVLSSYEVWAFIFGKDIGILRKDLASSIKCELDRKKGTILTKLIKIFQDEFKKTNKLLLSSSERLRNISNELQLEALQMEISDMTEEDFGDHQRCREIINKLDLPPDAVARFGRKREKHGKPDTVCICIRADQDLDICVDEDIAVDFKTFKTASEDIQNLLEKAQQEYRCELNKKHIAKTIKKYTSNLMQNHSNLRIISASDVKLSDDGETVVKSDDGYIQLICEGKGIIPIGEEEFPKRLDNYEVVVLEGNFHIGALPFAGCGIRLAGGLFAGTMGPVFRHGSDKCFLTCCHVLCGEHDMLRGHLNIPSTNVVEQQSGSIIGDVRSHTGVVNNIVKDLATVRLSSEVSDIPNIEVGLDEIEFGCEIFKIGCVSGLTRGLLIFHGAASNFFIGGRYYVFENLVVILNHPSNRNQCFFKQGDSGCACYGVKDEDGQRRVLQLIGIGNAFMNGTSISFAISLDTIKNTCNISDNDFQNFQIQLMNDVAM